jgi:segregation and condensation protein B
MVTDSMSEHVTDISYSQGEEELNKIEGELSEISTSSDFFEQEKIRQKMKKDADKAQDIRDALIMDEEVSNRDKNWLAKYEESLLAPIAAPESSPMPQEMTEDESSEAAHAEDEIPFYEEADEAH